MLAVPIVNPVVIMSTYYAFPDNISVVIYRTIGGVVGALIVGLLTGIMYDNKRRKMKLLKMIMLDFIVIVVLIVIIIIFH